MHLPPSWMEQRSLRLFLCFLCACVLPFASPQEGGNPFCFAYPNDFEDISYEKCCHDHISPENDCFSRVGGWYTKEFCCSAAVFDGTCVDHFSSLIEVFDYGHLNPLMSMLHACCMFPPTDGKHHECWETFEHFSHCCYGTLRAKLDAPLEEDPPWLAAEVSRALAPLGQQRWGPRDLEEFQRNPIEIYDASVPCRLRIRQGSPIKMCNLTEFCVIHGRPDLDGYDCSYVKAVWRALNILHAVRPLPDMDLMVSPTNRDRWQTSVPVFTRHRARKQGLLYVLLPMEWQLAPEQHLRLFVGVHLKGLWHPWEERAPSLVFRGKNSNVPLPCSITQAALGIVPWSSCMNYTVEPHWTWENWLNTPRGRLVFLSMFLEGLDAKWTGVQPETDPSLASWWESHNLTGEYVSQDAQHRWRYTINVDGTGNGDRIYWQLATGSVVLTHDSPMESWLLNFEEGQESTLKPFEHYVPVRFDMSDLPAKLEWLRNNDEEAQRIMMAGRHFAHSYLGHDGILLYLDRLLRRYARDHLEQPWPDEAGDDEAGG
ncbi:unnamed protein product [Polarella glacialis]|uniref:Glycosyl transferase CAP10 domain-containing protein n=1 Tax=Polarella glacialis TaxID=89957 RepID=A0A813LC45_POLGL|nr:unnamed protein product [Polarella glacialis]